MMLNCFHATRLMSESRERPLTARERASLMLHTAMCRACRNFGRQLTVMSKISKQFVTHSAPENPSCEKLVPAEPS
jgi:hypothetical protein